MLNFQKLIGQIDGVGKEHLLTGSSAAQTLASAKEAYLEAAAMPESIYARLVEAELTAFWPVAIPLEPFAQVSKSARLDIPLTVVAADGSQIMPSHHEVYNCYLLNIGTTLITYGVKLPPLLDSVPRLYHRAEDLYPLVDRRRLHIDEQFVALERNLEELSTLRLLTLQALERKLPVVAFVDGSLIPFSLDKMPDSYRHTYLERLSAILESFRLLEVPLLGYISQSRAYDVINVLRISKCPFPQSRCKDYCAHLNEEDTACSVVWPSTDRQLMSTFLEPLSRSNIFASGSSVLSRLPGCHHIAFTYVNVGQEIARLEFPRWLSQDSKKLDLSVAVVISQAEKGQGYPVCLAEAHNQAVIRACDRARFFELLRLHLVGMGVEKVRVSPKEGRKRHGIV